MTALERTDAIEDFKQRCSGRALATTNGYLDRARFAECDAVPPPWHTCQRLGHATTGDYVGRFRSAWETVLLLANGLKPTRPGRSKRWSNREELARIDLRWHDLRHEALSRLADDGVPGHELQMLADHASITTTQRYMNARANSLAESMRQTRARRVQRLTNEQASDVQAG